MKTKTALFTMVTILASLGVSADTSRGALNTAYPADQPAQMLVYIGTYAEKNAEGIYIFQLDLQTGALSRVGAVSGVKNPSFQAIHPDKPFLYTVGESSDFQGQQSGSVGAYAIDKETGKLTYLNEEATIGTDPCHVIVDRVGKHVLAANYSGGSVVVLSLKPDGRVGAPARSTSTRAPVFILVKLRPTRTASSMTPPIALSLPPTSGSISY